MTKVLKLFAGSFALTGVISCSEPEAAAQYLAGMPLVYGTRLGQPWSGPSTCVPGVRAAEGAQQDQGWDSSQLWYDVRGFTDSATLREAWANSAVCVTDMPPLPQDSAAFVAVLTGGIVTKMIYVFSADDYVALANSLFNMVSQNLGEEWVSSETAPEWTNDTLRVSLVSQGANLFGVPLVQIRSRRGCRWLQERFASSPDAALARSCW